MRGRRRRIFRYHLYKPLAETRVLYRSGTRRRFSQRNRGKRGCSPVVGGCGGTYAPRRDLPHTQHNFGEKLRLGLGLQLSQERRLEEGELLEPDGILDGQIELFETDLGRPGMRSDGLTDEIVPVTLQAEFEESGFEAQALGESRKDRAGRIEGTGPGHAAS